MLGRESEKHLSLGQGRNVNQDLRNVSHFSSINLTQKDSKLGMRAIVVRIHATTSLRLKDTEFSRHIVNIVVAMGTAL